LLLSDRNALFLDNFYKLSGFFFVIFKPVLQIPNLFCFSVMP